MPGPPPKRDGQRRRSNPPAKGPAQKAPAAGKVKVPAADRAWHPIARQWYEALGRSGQSVFYEPSDWWTAFAVAESMSREFSPQPVVGRDGEVTMVSLPPKAASLAAWFKAMSSLMVMEGDRRRLRLELERDEPAKEASDVEWIDDARRRLRESS